MTAVPVLYVVTKQPTDMDGCAEIVGVFRNIAFARDACKGAGTYLVARCQLDRPYKTGQLLDVECLCVSPPPAPSPA